MFNLLGLNLLGSKAGKRLLFGSLYLSEGAPIGFLWEALPTLLRAEQVPVEQITVLLAVLVLPWTFKFAWAPLVDAFRSPRWTLRHWVITSQLVMGITLLPLLWVKPDQQFSLLAVILITHAFAAATQDVAIDALCISVTEPEERGQYNGWMQAGMLTGRAAMGGGALILSQVLPTSQVVLLLIAITTFSAVLVYYAEIPAALSQDPAAGGSAWKHLRTVLITLLGTFRSRSTWLAFGFALTAGAAFEGLGAIRGPFLYDRGFTRSEIGVFLAGPAILLMMGGSLTGGWLADRIGRRRCVAMGMGWIIVSVGALAVAEDLLTGERPTEMLYLLASVAWGIGFFTASSYALFMDLTNPVVAATQFSAFMGATNGCESWSSLAIGRWSASMGYSTALIMMSGVSLVALLLLTGMRPAPDASPAPDARSE